MLIINRISLYFDQDLRCGHKELTAELNISHSTISKYLKKGISRGIIYSKKAEDDNRRSYFYPSTGYLDKRHINLKKLMEIE